MDRLRRRLARLARIGSAAIAFVFLLVHLTPLVPAITRRMASWEDEPNHGVLIVLGAEQNADGTLGIMSYWRCIHAVRAWRAGRFSQVLVSGGASNHLVMPDNPAAASPSVLAGSMAEFLQAMGVPKDRIVVESGSSSTHLNATYSAPILRSLAGPYTLITSDFHILRAQRCFRRAGIDVHCRPAPDILKRSNDWRQRWHCAIVLAEEWAKLAYYWWMDWI